jgi:hypothetical protein
MQNARAAISAPARLCPARLVTEPQLLNQLAVRFHIGPPQVIQKSASLAYHLQEAAATVVILAVFTEMFREVVDALRQDGNLNPRRTGVTFVRPMLLNRGGFVERHCSETAVSVLGELFVAVELKRRASGMVGHGFRTSVLSKQASRVVEHHQHE